MYLPPQFEPKDRGHAIALMREYPFASLVSVGDDGLPFVTHLPLHLREQGEELLLLGHVARPNPHWRLLAARPKALVTFLGAHGYMSPAVYPDPARVPTWNYLAVHCTVQARLIDDAEGKDEVLKTLIADHEPRYAEQWRALPEDFRTKMLSGIVAFELRVTALQCKLKLNQHRPEAFARMREAYAVGGENGRALLAWMDRLGMGAPAGAPAGKS
ncbi:MAG: FMN-binding negative transcriptional regulator [Proteobacteria bacterium]|nr:FMN-binding negative transcriptional regulator [Pseudomonadota bacterium]